MVDKNAPMEASITAEGCKTSGKKVELQEGATFEELQEGATFEEL